MPDRTAGRHLPTVLRLIILAGFAVVAYLLVSAGAARADDKPAIPGVKDVVEAVTPAREDPIRKDSAEVTRIVKKVPAKVEPVTRTLKPVTKPVTKTVERVTKPVTKPVTKTVERVTKPVTKTIRPVTEPLAKALKPVTAPLTKPIAAVPLPRPVPVADPVIALPDSPARAPAALPVAPIAVAQPLAVAQPHAVAPPIAVAQPLAVAQPVAGATALHHIARPPCAEHAPASTRHHATVAATGGDYPVPVTLPAYLRLLNSWITGGADLAPQAWAVTPAAWLPAADAAATVTTGFSDHSGRCPAGAAPPG
ncbi:hypothetical protein [Actinoplanes sp. GCM10030250]|uniref:hypothetical protein n=1 Tax=Actinoplanes sp. GCM10030250 TaxID=3273376 RepID=UPI0036115633